MNDNDELKNQYLSILKDLRQTAEQGKEFVVEQAPLVAQEIVTCRIVESGVAVCTLVAGAIAVGILATVIYRKARVCEDDEMRSLLLAGTMVVGPIIAIGMLGAACERSAVLLKAIYAPRVVVLEEVGKLLK